MDDLSGLDWNANSGNSKTQTSAAKPAFAYPTLQPTPSPIGSGRSTPLDFKSAQNTGNPAQTMRTSSKPPTPANDSFANLLNPNGSKQQNLLSLQERQKQIQEEKARQEAERNQKLATQYGGQQGAFWDSLGRSRTASPLARPPVTSLPPGNKSGGNAPGIAQSTTTGESNTEDELLAAFDSAAPVDSSSYYPPPRDASGRSTPATVQSKDNIFAKSLANGGLEFAQNDDDPFGLGQMSTKAIASAPPTNINNDDDDILGLLGRPAAEFVKPVSVIDGTTASQSPSPEFAQTRQDDHPQAKAVAELVDMGFPADKAAAVLARTESGLNVQEAVGILLNQAHDESRQKARGQPGAEENPFRNGNTSGQTVRPTREDSSLPAWMRTEGASARSDSRSSDGRSRQSEKDLAKQAQDIGSNLFKSANSLWKTSQKKVQKAVADFQQEGDSSQPKWMRDVQARDVADERRPPRDQNVRGPGPPITNEAMLLESGGRPPKPPRSTEASRSSTPSSQLGSWNDIPDEMFSARRPATLRSSSTQAAAARPAQRLTRHEVENTAAEVMVSSRRRRVVPTPATTTLVPAGDGAPPIPSPSLQSRNPFASKPPNPAPSATPLPTRPKAPPRNIPAVSSLALQNSSAQRASGSEAFKRGDYSAAHSHYTSSLQGIPQSHPIAIVIFCNRALTSIKVGDPRGAVADADVALRIIGASNGENERIILGGTDGEKEMKEFYGKALMRKAEALESMEKWVDAANIWRQAVEAGVGGSVSMQGRNRCEKAAQGTSANGSPASNGRSIPTSQPAARRPAAAKPKITSAMGDLAPPSASSAEAVRKLREASAAAERLDDEKFALIDTVDAKLAAWKGTKADNLRALLGSLEKVLWPEAGWAKVGMQDLVLPNRVKIVYMKAIAKVHPDKVGAHTHGFDQNAKN